jgi:hypothetical protein
MYVDKRSGNDFVAGTRIKWAALSWKIGNAEYSPAYKSSLCKTQVAQWWAPPLKAQREGWRATLGKVIKGGYFMSPPSKLAMLRFPGLPGTHPRNKYPPVLTS